MRPARRSLLALVVVIAAALGSSACIEPQTLGTLRGAITPQSMLADDGVRDLAARSALHARTWAAAVTIVALFWLHFRLRAGDHEALGSFALHTTLAYALLAPTLSDALYWPRAAANVGQAVAELYPITDWIDYGGTTSTRPNFGLTGFARAGWEGTQALRARVATGGDRSDVRFLEAEAIAQLVSTPLGALFVLLATTGSYISALALQITQATTLAVLAVLFPIMVPLLILPWTRPLFFGYVRWVAAVLLWGATFRILDAVMLAVQLRSLIQPLRDAVAADDAWAVAQIIPNFLAAGVIVHLAFFALQFAAPAVAFGIVHGTAQRSLR